MTPPPYHVLFLCTGNSARSILSEALLNHFGAGRFVAHSAGSMPTGKVNPFALETLKLRGIPVENPRSKSWDEFAFPDGRSRDMDIIITVCDNAAGEICPVWPGHPVTAHWGVPDPAHVEGSETAKMRAFAEAFDTLKARVQDLIALPLEELGAETLKSRLRSIADLHPPAAAP